MGSSNNEDDLDVNVSDGNSKIDLGDVDSCGGNGNDGG